MKMHEILEGMRATWDSLSHSLRASLLLGMIMFFKFIYEDDRRKAKRRNAETAIAMLVTYLLGKFAMAIGLTPEWAYAIAVGVWAYGIDALRSKAIDLINKKIDKE